MPILKQDMVELISQLPLPMIGQFYKLACYYFGYVNAEPDKKLSLRSKYVRETCQAEMMLNTIIMLSANGEDVLPQIEIKPEFMSALQDAYDFFTEHSTIVPPGDDLPAEIIDEDIQLEEMEKPEPVVPEQKSKIQRALEKKFADAKKGGK